MWNALTKSISTTRSLFMAIKLATQKRVVLGWLSTWRRFLRTTTTPTVHKQSGNTCSDRSKTTDSALSSMSASDTEEHKRLKGLLEYHQMIVHEWLKEGDRPYLCFGAYSVEELTGL